MQRSALCRSRRELSGFDTAENEFCKVCPLSAYRSLRFSHAGECLSFQLVGRGGSEDHAAVGIYLEDIRGLAPLKRKKDAERERDDKSAVDDSSRPGSPAKTESSRPGSPAKMEIEFWFRMTLADETTITLRGMGLFSMLKDLLKEQLEKEKKRKRGDEDVKQLRTEHDEHVVVFGGDDWVARAARAEAALRGEGVDLYRT